VLPGRVEVSARGSDCPIFRQHERAIQLRQFLQRATEIRIEDAGGVRHVSDKRIEDQRTRVGQHCISIANREQRADAATFSSFAGNFNRKFQDCT
jgi:hypothetical protein